MRSFILMALLVSGGLWPTTTALAQEASEAGVVAVQYFKCQDTATFDRIVQDAWLPQVQMALEDGRLLDWKQLNHAWGDEWNRVLYNTAPDLQTFHAIFDEMSTGAFSEQPDLMAELETACSEHKDNIYAVAEALPME